MPLPCYPVFATIVRTRRLGTAHYLLGTSEPSYRFAALWESKRLDLTVEALVLENPEWAIFFPKRSNKGGSWMKGHIRQRGKGSRALALDLGRSEEGKRRQKWISGFKTKRDAERELARVIHEMNTGAYLEPSKMTVGDYLKRWIEDYARPNVAPKTFQRYVKIVRLHLTPALGSHPLGKLQPLHIQAYYSQALQSGRRDGKGELAAQTIPHHHRVLREALAQAVKWQILVRNPADAVEPPRPQRPEMRALDKRRRRFLLTPPRAAVCTYPLSYPSRRA